MAVRTRGAVDAGIPARPTAATASPCLGAKAKGQAQRAHSCAGLAGLLAEFRRVVRPGGLVALKEFDTALVRLAPAPVTLFWHYWEVAALHTPQIRGCLRGPKLRTALRQAEFANTTLRIILFGIILSERCAPLAEVDRRYLAGMLGFWSRQWLELAAAGAQPGTTEGHQCWQDLARSDGLNSFLNHPDCTHAAGNIVAVGSIPGDENLRFILLSVRQAAASGRMRAVGARRARPWLVDLWGGLW